MLVSELPMKERLLQLWPQLQGRIMTARDFARGFSPDDESLSPSGAHIEDAGGHTPPEKLHLH